MDGDDASSTHASKTIERECSDSSLQLTGYDSASEEAARAELEEVVKDFASTSLRTFIDQHGIPLHGASVSAQSEFEQASLVDPFASTEYLQNDARHQELDFTITTKTDEEEEDIMQDFLTQCCSTRLDIESGVNIPLEYMNGLLGRLVESSSSSTSSRPAGPPSMVFAKVDPLFNAVHPLPTLAIIGSIVALHGDPEWHLQLVQLFEVVGVSCNWCILRACHFHSYLLQEQSQLALVDVQAPWGAGRWEFDDRCLIFQELIDAVAVPSWHGWMRFEYHQSSRFKYCHHRV